MRRAIAAALPLTCVLALGWAAVPAASGAELTAAQYKRDVNRLSQQFAYAGLAFQKSIHPSTTIYSAARKLRLFRGRVRVIARKVGRLAAPSFVAAANRELSRALGAIAYISGPAIRAGLAGRRAAFRNQLLVLRNKLQGSAGNRLKRAARRVDSLLAHH